MISVFRHHLQGRFLRTIVYAVCLLMVLPYSFTILFKWFAGEDWALKVDRTKVSMQAYQVRVDEVTQQIEQFKKMFGPQAEQLLRMQGLPNDPNKIALEALVLQALMHNVAYKFYLAISPDFVHQQVLASLPKELRRPDGSVDKNLVAQYLHKTLEQVEQQRREQLIGDILLSMTEGAVYVPQFMIKDRFMQEYADRRCTLASVPLSVFITQQQQKGVTDTQLKAFFDAQNRLNKRYFVPEKRAGIVWLFDADKYGLVVSEQKIKEYYNRRKYQEFVEQPARLHVRHILLAFDEKNKSTIRAQANAVLQELKAQPDLFAQKARELSADTQTKNKGGLLEFTKGDKNQLFEQAASRLLKDGDISPVLETPEGFEIIQRVAKKAPVYKAFEKVRDQIELTLRTQQFSHIFGYESKYALMRAENKEQALAEFARKKNARKKEIGLTAITSDPLIQKLFNARRDTGSFEVDKSTGYAVFVTDLKKTYQPSFESVKEQVRHDWYEQQALESLNHVLAQARVIHDKAALESFARQNGAKVEPSLWIRKADKKSLQALEQRVGQQLLQRLFMTNRAGVVVTDMHGQAGFMLFVDEMAQFNQQKFDEHKATVLQTLMQEQKRFVEQSFIASLYKNATIKISEKIAK